MAFLVCPTCKKKFDSESSDAMPFCSKRCRLADLNGWFEERFSIPLDVEKELERQENESESMTEEENKNDWNY